ncbi:MAG: hypothetical protein AAB458_00390 [Patescibacteria group bacterium]
MKKSLRTKLAELFIKLVGAHSINPYSADGRARNVWCLGFNGGKRFALIRDGRGHALGSWWGLYFKFGYDGELIWWGFTRNYRESGDVLIEGRGEAFQLRIRSFFPRYEGGAIIDW